ncbi:hypothetical protein [Pedobacter terrae]
MLLLCPNHHKEFDLGELEFHLQKTDRVEFTLNGIRHALDLSWQSKTPTT